MADNTANMKTQVVTLAVIDEWQELGDPERRDNLLDIFNETGVEVRLYMGDKTIAAAAVVDSVPLVAGGNYYIDFSLSNKVYVKTENASGVGKDVSFVEG